MLDEHHRNATELGKGELRRSRVPLTGHSQHLANSPQDGSNSGHGRSKRGRVQPIGAHKLLHNRSRKCLGSNSSCTSRCSPEALFRVSNNSFWSGEDPRRSRPVRVHQCRDFAAKCLPLSPVKGEHRHATPQRNRFWSACPRAAWVVRRMSRAERIAPNSHRDETISQVRTCQDMRRQLSGHEIGNARARRPSVQQNTKSEREAHTDILKHSQQRPFPRFAQALVDHLARPVG